MAFLFFSAFEFVGSFRFGAGWLALREAVSAHVPDRGGDLWITIILTMTRLHVILFNMGSVLASWYPATSVSRQMNHRRLRKVSRRATLRMRANRNFSDVSFTGVLQYSGLFLFIEGTQVVGVLPSVT